MAFVWTPLGVGYPIENEDLNEIRTNLDSIYSYLEITYPGCTSGAGWTGVWPLKGKEAGTPDSIQSAHPQELRDKTDYADDHYCSADKASYNTTVYSNQNSTYKSSNNSGVKSTDNATVYSGQNSTYRSTYNSGVDSTDYGTVYSGQNSSYKSTYNSGVDSYAYGTVKTGEDTLYKSTYDSTVKYSYDSSAKYYDYGPF